MNALTGSDGIDLCISRPKSRLRWGIELPFDKDYVTFVWFDALTNYASFAGYRDEDPAGSGLPKFEDLWPCDAHVIGKDILIPAHGVYWMIMLHACGLSDAEMPKFLVHGFWNLEGRKYSKSEAVEADPTACDDHFRADYLDRAEPRWSAAADRGHGLPARAAVVGAVEWGSVTNIREIVHPDIACETTQRIDESDAAEISAGLIEYFHPGGAAVPGFINTAGAVDTPAQRGRQEKHIVLFLAVLRRLRQHIPVVLG